jgi:hypothetical protein
MGACALPPAAAVTITSTFFFRDNQDPVQPSIIPGIGGGDAITIGAFVTDISDVSSGTATHLPTGSVVTLDLFTTVFPGIQFTGTDMAYPVSEPAKLLGSNWRIDLDGVGGPASASPTRDLTGVARMPFVTNLNATGSASNPTVTWTLPPAGTGPTIDRIQVQVYNDDANVLIGSTFLSAGATSVSVGNVLGASVPSGQLAVRVIPINGGQPLPQQVTRSSNWLVIDTTGAKAGGQVAVLTTGSPATLTQDVATPALPFQLSFEYRFTTVTGILSVLLNGVQIGVDLMAPSVIGSEFLLANFEVDNPLLLGLTAVPLTFLLDGPTGSQVEIDNVTAPGLLNGAFGEGLAAWTPGGDGAVTLATVPEPSTGALLGLALVTFVLGWTRDAVRRRSVEVCRLPPRHHSSLPSPRQPPRRRHFPG